MEKKIAGLLGAVAALGTISGAQAAPAPASDPSDALKVNSYAELLEPIPNAVKVLEAIDEQQPVKPWEDNIKVAQFYHHHHHHHHHGFRFGFGIAAPPVYYGGDCYWRRTVHINRWGERVVRRVRVCD